MELFQSVKKLYQTMGVYSPQSDRIYSINSNLLFFTVSMASYISSIFAYFLFRAKTIGDYGTSFNISMAGLSALSQVFVTFWQMPTVLRLIENCEQFIETSKKKFRIFKCKTIRIFKLITKHLNRN